MKDIGIIEVVDLGELKYELDLDIIQKENHRLKGPTLVPNGIYCKELDGRTIGTRVKFGNIEINKGFSTNYTCPYFKESKCILFDTYTKDNVKMCGINMPDTIDEVEIINEDGNNDKPYDIWK